MSTSLRALIVEDSENDALLVLRELRRGGYDVTWERVETAETMRAALDRQPWDIVISDYKMPHFTGLEALNLLRAGGVDLPFILVSGTVGEDMAVQAMKAGANDYLMKGKLGRLVPAVERELRDAAGRREHKRADTALAAEQTLLTNLLKTSPDNIYFKNRQSRFVRVNDMMAQYFGVRSPKDMVGKSDFDFFSEEHARQAYEDEQQVIRTGKPIIGLVEKETWPDGRVTWVSTTKVPLRDADGNFTGLVGISRDITERKRADDHIREQAALLDEASDCIYVVTLDSTILYWNRAAEHIYGWPAAAAVGRKTTDLIATIKPPVADLIAAVVQNGGWSGERRQTTKAGRPVDMWSRLTLLRDDQGQPEKILVINTDITAKKELEARFLRAQRLESIGALASGIAHDLNNVLAPIIMGAELMRPFVTDQRGQHVLAMMEMSARRGAGIVRQVLTFVRGTSGEPVSVQPVHLVRDVVRILEESLPKNIQIEDESAAGIWPVNVDATQLHQALMNLCINARDAMSDGGRLILSAENVSIDEAAAALIPGAHEGRYVRLRVRDTGTGIAPEQQERIFEPFYTTKALGKGTGLGLSTTLGIVRAHGGFMRLDSHVGQGTTFDLFIPASPAAASAAAPGPEHHWPQANGELVLVVDDEAAVREVVRRALEAFGYRVINCPTGAEAIVRFRASQNDVRLVVTDIMMPEMDGPALALALRAIAPSMPILGMTGVCDSATMQHLQTLAFTTLIAKPFTVGELLTAVNEAIGVAARPGGLALAENGHPTPAVGLAG
jgi:PAS domain S-box-containing protein